MKHLEFRLVKIQIPNSISLIMTEDKRKRRRCEEYEGGASYPTESESGWTTMVKRIKTPHHVEALKDEFLQYMRRLFANATLDQQKRLLCSEFVTQFFKMNHSEAHKLEQRAGRFVSIEHEQLLTRIILDHDAFASKNRYDMTTGWIRVGNRKKNQDDIIHHTTVKRIHPWKLNKAYTVITCTQYQMEKYHEADCCEAKSETITFCDFGYHKLDHVCNSDRKRHQFTGRCSPMTLTLRYFPQNEDIIHGTSMTAEELVCEIQCGYVMQDTLIACVPLPCIDMIKHYMYLHQPQSFRKYYVENDCDEDDE
jgi:hypothetical protein